MSYINRKLIEFNNELANKKIAIIGMGVSNIPLIDYFYKYKAKITIFDKRTIDNLDDIVLKKINEYNIEYSLGENNLSKLHGFDYIFRSPSCRPDTKELVEEEKNGGQKVETPVWDTSENRTITTPVYDDVEPAWDQEPTPEVKDTKANEEIQNEVVLNSDRNTLVAPDKKDYSTVHTVTPDSFTAPEIESRGVNTENKEQPSSSSNDEIEIL